MDARTHKMPLNLASPGVKVREVDLTTGRVDPVSERSGGLVAPFAQGPVDLPVLIGSEKDLLDNFGKPYSNDKHYEHWMTASSYLAYGGSLRVIRADSELLNNSTDSGATLKIKNVENYEQLQYDENIIPGSTIIAKNPGSWANGLRVAVIDSKTDQTLTLDSYTNIEVGMGVSQTVLPGTVVSGAGTTSTLNGYFKGIVTGVTTAGTNAGVEVKFVSHVDENGTETNKDYQYNGIYRFNTGDIKIVDVNSPTVPADTTVSTRGSLNSTPATHTQGTSVDTYYLEETLLLDQPGGANLSPSDTTIGISTSNLGNISNKYLIIGNEIIFLGGAATVNEGTISGITRAQDGTAALTHSDGDEVKVVTKIAGAGTLSSAVQDVDETSILLSGVLGGELNIGGLFKIDSEFFTVTNVISSGTIIAKSCNSTSDWFQNQKISVSSNSVGGTETVITIDWSSIADRPGTSDYASRRGARFDEVHVVVIDGDGRITGNSGSILERHLNLSKAKDAQFSTGSPSYWRSYLKDNSAYTFAGGAPSGITDSGFLTEWNVFADKGWDQNSEDTNNGPIIFGGAGNLNYVLTGGKNYDGSTNIENSGALTTTLSKLSSGYNIFRDDENSIVDFLIMGSANYSIDEARALAEQLISIADFRKDCIAFISPYRQAFLIDTDSGTVTVNDSETITNKVLEYYSPLTASSYAVFDSGYKYMFDRFANTFRYVPLNGDIAGICARNDVDSFPWFSPAGTTRGTILNSIKLAYNPSLSQRDRLYSARVNPVIFTPGSGIVLFGDKTALGKASAFDRINVRRLFVYLAKTITSAANDQLFEFNDEITRTNFVNIIEPFLRDIQAKRGIQDYVVICDETNNTAAIIDNNEFVADIYIKPQRSINFIGLTFVATRTGVSFEEVIGNV